MTSYADTTDYFYHNVRKQTYACNQIRENGVLALDRRFDWSALVYPSIAGPFKTRSFFNPSREPDLKKIACNADGPG